eukprot:3254148-Prymnesium_polylepis.1
MCIRDRGSGSSQLQRITAVGTHLKNDRGIVMFAPEDDTFASPYTTFSFKFVDPEDPSQQSAEATTTIDVTGVNDAPIGSAMSRMILNNTQAEIFTLAAADVDENATDPLKYSPGFSEHVFAKITRFPLAGRLYQVTPAGTLGDMLDATVTSVPTVSMFVDSIVRFSSQFSKCNAGNCFVWSGAEGDKTGCNQANVRAKSTCRGSSCRVPYGETI